MRVIYMINLRLFYVDSNMIATLGNHATYVKIVQCALMRYYFDDLATGKCNFSVQLAMIYCKIIHT